MEISPTRCRPALIPVHGRRRQLDYFSDHQTTQVYALTNPGYGAVETDWSGVDLAVRAKKLGMSVFLNLFYDGMAGIIPVIGPANL